MLTIDYDADRVTEVAQQVPAVRHLDRIRCALAHAVRIGAGPPANASRFGEVAAQHGHEQGVHLAQQALRAIALYRVVKGRRQQIAGASAKVPSGLWHTLTLRAEGDRLAVSFDGKQLLTHSDRTFAGPGKVALWTKADSVTQFDDLRVMSLDR